MLNLRYYLLLSVCLFWGNALVAQYAVKGKILDESNMGIPFADVYVKNDPDLRTRADIEGNFLIRLQVGGYQMVFSARGYQQREYYLVVNEQNQDLNIQLFPIEIKDFEEVDFSVKRRNVGRDIIMNAVRIKDQIDFNQYPYSCDVYIKAKDEKGKTEQAVKKEKEKKKDKNKADARYDDVEDLKQKQLDALDGINMVEVELNRSYLPPNYIKEIRTGYKKRGSDKYLYFTTTAKSNFNFFLNILYLNDLSKNPIQSPISTAGILSYKYQLVEKIERENMPAINKIKISPRNIATSTLEGYIWIEDSTWFVKKLDFTINSGNLYIYDNFSVMQDFESVGDSICILKNQTMNYSVSFKKETFKGQTTVNYRNYDFNPGLTKKMFSNELAVTTEKAYERDSVYWEDKRITPLTSEEQSFIQRRDSIENLFTKVSYLDSIDSVFNKVTFWKVVWFGIDHRNRIKKTQWTLSSIAAMIRPLYIAGPRVGPDFEIFKKWDNEHTLDAYARVDIGILNADIKGTANLQYLYNPFRQSTIGLSFTHDYDLIRSYDALTQVFLRDNFIEKTAGTLSHNFEVLNGLYLESNFTYTNRRPIPEDTRFIRWFDKALNNTEPPEFNAYNAIIADFTLSYTPYQKYMREPNRKVVLGSKWPTVFVYYEKGVPKLLGSEVDFDYLRFGVRQTFKIGTIGTSQYRVTTGKFVNNKILKPVDYKYHRRSDPILFSNPLYSYQDLDSTLPTMNWYFESHYIHHFNGAIMNLIPFMKKTRISLVAGGGYLWVPEHEWIHYELFVGLERIFKFAKRRLRIGAYAAFSEGNHLDKVHTSFKISFAILDERNMKFSF